MKPKPALTVLLFALLHGCVTSASLSYEDFTLTLHFRESNTGKRVVPTGK